MSDQDLKIHRMSAADNVVNRIFVFINFFAIAASLVILVVTTGNVIMRAFFSHPINGALELSTDMMVMVSYCSLPIITLLSDHISVDLLFRKLPEGLRKALKIFNLCVYSVLCCFASYATFIKGTYEKGLGTSGNALRIPYYIFYYIIAVMLLISVICAIYNIVHIFVAGQEVTAAGIKEYSKRLLQKKADTKRFEEERKEENS